MQGGLWHQSHAQHTSKYSGLTAAQDAKPELRSTWAHASSSALTLQHRTSLPTQNHIPVLTAQGACGLQLITRSRTLPYES